MGKASRRKKSRHASVPFREISTALGDVMNTFALQDAMSRDERYLCCMLTALAWNLSLLPLEQRTEALESFSQRDTEPRRHPVDLFVTFVTFVTREPVQVECADESVGSSG